MEQVWIIGGGRFGRLAATRLENQYRILVVDPDETAVPGVLSGRITQRVEDGVSFLARNLKADTRTAWIIPSLPVHLAYEWCRKKIGKERLAPQPVDPEILSVLPHPVQGAGSQIYVSHADFICPDNCSEPETICTRTKRPRKTPMYSFLQSLRFKGAVSIGIRSRQVAPGVGGYTPDDLFRMLRRIETSRGDLLVSTACKCHGVISCAFKC